MKNLRLGMSFMFFAFLLCFIAAPQSFAQEDSPIPWPCYKSTVDRSEAPMPCYTPATQKDSLVQLETAFLQDDTFVAQCYFSSNPDNVPVQQRDSMPAAWNRDRNAYLKVGSLLEAAAFRS